MISVIFLVAAFLAESAIIRFFSRGSFRKRIILAVPIAFIGVMMGLAANNLFAKSLSDADLMSASYLLYLAFAIPLASSPIIAEIILAIWTGTAILELEHREDSRDRAGIIAFAAVSACLTAMIVVAQIVLGRPVFWIGM